MVSISVRLGLALLLGQYSRPSWQQLGFLSSSA